jgi:hypothetical protein
MRVALLCTLAAGLVRGAPLGQRSLDAHLGLIDRDLAALEKTDTAFLEPERCDDVCTTVKKSWEKKCTWVECKGCKGCDDPLRKELRDVVEMNRRLSNQKNEAKKAVKGFVEAFETKILAILD